MDLLKAKGIGSAVQYPIPIPRQPLYAPVADPDPCPVATRLSKTVLSLPVHPSLDTKDLAYICETLNRVS
jgi:perosamine synthetase